MGNFQQKFFTPKQALQKIQHYCSYQERTHYEVKEKLYSYGLKKNEVEDLLATLIETNFLNEERFAEQFAGGKFRMKKWGKIKIQHELKLKKVSARNIQHALNTIQEYDYLKTLSKLATIKWNSLKTEHYMSKKVKTTRYLLQKGYEHKLIQNIITFIISKNNSN